MTGKQPTSVDVARLAGVSQSTVSRSFDPGSRISDETRARVMAAATDLGYQPNVLARSLSTQRTDIVGIVMANLTNSHFYPGVLERFTHRLQEMGKQILLLSAPPGRSAEEMVPLVLGYQIDALIIASMSPGDEAIDLSGRGGRPVILFNRFAAETNASIVCCDCVGGGRLVADYLLDAGHKRIAYLAGPESATTNLMREQGFTERLEERGYSGLLREQADYTYDAGHQAALRLLGRKNPPEAVFCASDIIALGAMDAARFELGIQIPEDLSVVGFDDIAAAHWPTYDLTTIRQPVDDMVEAALTLLERDEERTPQAARRLLPVDLVVRGSTRR
jgi:DNA-binding LacI/PurR family transcriptional regulator